MCATFKVCFRENRFLKPPQGASYLITHVIRYRVPGSAVGAMQPLRHIHVHVMILTRIGYHLRIPSLRLTSFIIASVGMHPGVAAARASQYVQKYRSKTLSDDVPCIQCRPIGDFLRAAPHCQRTAGTGEKFKRFPYPG